MSIFFGAQLDDYKTEISIPCFDNYNSSMEGISLYSFFSDGDSWIVNEENEITNDFTKIKTSAYDLSKTFFFIANSNHYDSKTIKLNEIERISSFTKTFPDYRANLKIFKPQKGFSSYQSEYPYEMLKVRGSIVSSLSLLTFKDASNTLILPSIINTPSIEKFECKIVCKSSNEEIKSFDSFTNRVNVFSLDGIKIEEQYFLVAKGFPCIPIYLCEREGSLSMEHTHPPHDTFIGDFRNLIKEYKNAF